MPDLFVHARCERTYNGRSKCCTFIKLLHQRKMFGFSSSKLGYWVRVIMVMSNSGESLWPPAFVVSDLSLLFRVSPWGPQLLWHLVCSTVPGESLGPPAFMAPGSALWKCTRCSESMWPCITTKLKCTRGDGAFVAVSPCDPALSASPENNGSMVEML